MSTIYYHNLEQIQDKIKWPETKMNRKEFISKCTACGGNWAAMFMSGIKECFPEMYESLPDDGTFDGILLMQIVSMITE